MNWKSRVILVVVVVAVAAAFYLQKASEAIKPIEPAKQASFLPIPEAASAPARIQSAPVASSAVLPIAELTLQQQVNKFVASGKPEDALAAYKLIWHCATVRKDQLNSADRVARGGAPAEKVSDACGDLDSAKITGAYQLLDKAARAGVHGATMLVIEAGDDGMGNNNPNPSPDDPNVDLFRQRLLDAEDAGAANGDCRSLDFKSNDSVNKQDYSAALDYLNQAEQQCKQQGTELRYIALRRQQIIARSARKQ